MTVSGFGSEADNFGDDDDEFKDIDEGTIRAGGPQNHRRNANNQGNLQARNEAKPANVFERPGQSVKK